MHIHLDENAARYAACESPKTVPYVSLETIAKFSNMTMTMTQAGLCTFGWCRRGRR